MAIAITTSSTNPLSDSASFLLQKTGGTNDQGKGVSYDFTIDNASKAKVMQISFDYIVNSGTFTAGTPGVSGTDSDIIVYVYDITNSRLIQPSTFKLFSNSSTIPDTFNAVFQTAHNSTSYRLIFHTATTTTSNFELKIDNIKVEKSKYAYGTPITDWQSYTPAIAQQGFGNITIANTYDARWRRNGDSLEISVRFTAGTVAASQARFDLPLGFTVDSVKTPSIKLADGYWIWNSTTGNQIKRGVVLVTGGLTYLNFGFDDYTNSSSPFGPQNGSALVSTGSVVSFFAKVPVLGWSSSVQMSDSADTRVVDFVGTATTTAANTNITATVTKDSHGAWSSNQYVVPVAGDYNASISAFCTSTIGWGINILKNGTIVSNGSTSIYSGISSNLSSTIIPDCKAGDVITFQTTANGGVVTNSANKIFISRISGPSAIAATESVNFEASRTAGNISINATPVTYICNSTIKDSHGGYNSSTGIYTVPVSGTYLIFAEVSMTFGATNYSGQLNLVYGTSNTIGFVSTDSTAVQYRCNVVSAISFLNAGQTIYIQTYTGAAQSGTAIGDSAVTNKFYAVRVGN